MPLVRDLGPLVPLFHPGSTSKPPIRWWISGAALPRISRMTLGVAYNEKKISPMNTGENEPQALESGESNG
jgi:hypothetical protein